VLVTVRLFARLREIAGAPELRIDVPRDVTVREIWTTLAGQFPELGPYTGTVSCAVNEDYARMTTPLEDGDEVAFLPPVSGGGQMFLARDVDGSGHAREKQYLTPNSYAR
jgi:molybdopterin converting factor subunit 1